MSDAYNPDDDNNDHDVIKKENQTGYNSTYLIAKKKRDLANPPVASTVVLTLSRGDKAPSKLTQHIVNLIPQGKKLEITEAALEQLGRFSARMSDGYQASVPITCLGEKDCQYAHSCPMVQAHMELPILQDCPIETHLFNQWTENKMIELGVEEDDELASVDRSQIKEFAQLEIIQRRANLEMALNPGVVTEKVIGFDNEGRPITSTEVNPRIAVISNLSTAKGRILNDLVGTRAARLKAGGVTKNMVNVMSELVTDLTAEKHNALEAKRKAKRDKKIKDIEVVVKDSESSVDGMEHYGAKD